MAFLGGTIGVPDSGDNGPQSFGSGREPVRSAYIVWGDPITDPGGQLGEIHFDVVNSEDHERDAEVTDHSVEQGASIVDHVRPLPDTITLDVFVSNTPVTSPDAELGSVVLDIPQPGQGSFLAGGTSGLLQSGAEALGLARKFPTQLSANVQKFSTDTDYVQNAYDLLTRLRDTATLLSVVTPRQVYTNMVLKRIAMHRDRSTGTSATFQLDLRQIRIVSSSIVDAPLPSIPAAAPAVNKGKVDPTAAPAPMQSVIRRASPGLGGAAAAGFPGPPPAP